MPLWTEHDDEPSAAAQVLRDWLEEIPWTKKQNWDPSLHSDGDCFILCDYELEQEQYAVLHLYTETYEYQVSARVDDETSSLGCIARARRTRPGEDWHRMNDLPDGKLNRDTWDNILAAIVGYELRVIGNRWKQRKDEIDPQPVVA